jgi:hypothetical protein
MMVKRSFHRGALARRVLEIRHECYGPDGVDELAAELDLPVRTWRNYESGVTIPGLELLEFMVRTRVHPTWLLTGSGDRFPAD